MTSVLSRLVSWPSRQPAHVCAADAAVSAHSRRSDQDRVVRAICQSVQPLPMDKLRLVIFRESDAHARRLIYDSATVLPAPQRRQSDTAAVRSPSRHGFRTTADGKFNLMKPLADTAQLGEMIFGTTTLAFKGESLKVHQLTDMPHQLMLTKVFPVPRTSRNHRHPVISENNTLECTSSESDRSDSQYSTVDSLVGIFPQHHKSRSVPMDVPERIYKKCSSSPGSSSTASDAAPHKVSLCPRLSPTATLSRSASAGGFPHVESPRQVPVSWGHSLSRVNRRKISNDCNFDACWLSPSRRNRTVSDCLSEADPDYSARCTQLGMAILFQVESAGDDSATTDESFRQFVLTHMHTIEAEMKRLQAEIQRACLLKTPFFNLVHEEWRAFRTAVSRLYSAPRLARPVWLSLMSDDSTADAVAGEFVALFGRLVRLYDTKATKYFVSTLLTSVLMHHLTWVSSVSPPHTDARTPQQSRVSNESSSENLAELIGDHTIDSTAIPYNSHWAQFLDVTGAVGYPVKEARTLVVGARRDLVAQLLLLLSYFVRCSDVRRRRSSLSADVDCQFVTISPPPPPKSFPPSATDRCPSAKKERSVHAADILQQLATVSDSNRNTGHLSSARDVLCVNSAEPPKSLVKDAAKGASFATSNSEPDLTTLRRLPPLRKTSDDRHNALTLLWLPCTYPAVDASPLPSNPGSDVELENVLEETDLNGDERHKNVSPVDSGIEELTAKAARRERCRRVRPSLHERLFADALEDEVVVTAPPTPTDSSNEASAAFLHNIGRSMLGGVSDCYCRHLALSGLAPHVPADLYATVHDDLRSAALTTSIGREDGESADAVCIVANVDDWNVTVMSSSCHDYTLKRAACTVASHAVVRMVETTKDLVEMGSSPELCLSYMEDRLGELYGKSCVLAEMVAAESVAVDTAQASRVVGCDWSDVPLLMSVAAAHSPLVLRSLVH